MTWVRILHIFKIIYAQVCGNTMTLESGDRTDDDIMRRIQV